MPIIGTIASSNQSGRVTDTGAMYPLQVVTVGSAGAASIDFNNIPSTYTHLQIRGIARSTLGASQGDWVNIQFNNDTASNYNWHLLYGDQSTTTLFGTGNGNSSNVTTLVRASASSATSSVFGAGVIDILDYANTNKFKTVRSLTGFDSNTVGGLVGMASGTWRSTSAITSIKLNTTSFVQFSSFALYGIKGA